MTNAEYGEKVLKEMYTYIMSDKIKRGQATF